MNTASTRELERAAENFRDEQSSLLNNTVTNGIRLEAQLIESEEPALVRVGYQLTSHDLRSGFIPVRLRAGRSDLSLFISHVLTWDDEGMFLADRSSTIGLYLTHSEGEPDPIIRWDYERGKELYPEAHIQVYGTASPAIELLQRKKQTGQRTRTTMDSLHWPVGGRRFRPTLEDVIEFLVVENLADGRRDWQSVVDTYRNRYLELQLKAAVRRNPEVAVAALESDGYGITRPK